VFTFFSSSKVEYQLSFDGMSRKAYLVISLFFAYNEVTNKFASFEGCEYLFIRGDFGLQIGK
jgi:hypothetical protein